MKSFLIILLLMFMWSNAIAGTGSGKVTRIYAHPKFTNGVDTGVILFNVEIHNDAPASCPGSEWAFNADTEHGKAMYALLLSAAAQGKPVYVRGAGDCADWGDRERPSWISVTY